MRYLTPMSTGELGGMNCLSDMMVSSYSCYLDRAMTTNGSPLAVDSLICYLLVTAALVI